MLCAYVEVIRDRVYHRHRLAPVVPKVAGHAHLAVVAIARLQLLDQLTHSPILLVRVVSVRSEQDPAHQAYSQEYERSDYQHGVHGS